MCDVAANSTGLGELTGRWKGVCEINGDEDLFV